MKEGSTDAELAELHDLVELRLRLTDQRYTSGRRAIVELLARSGHPVSIAEIAERLPSLPRSSAYRNLVDLETVGLIRRLTAHDDFARFELAEDITEHHHHLLCVSCGSVIDFTLSAQLERSVSAAIDKLAGRAGFQPSNHQLDVTGTCGACLERRASTSSPRVGRAS